MTEGQWYDDSSSGRLYLWAPGGGNPSAHDVGVIIDNAYEPGVFISQASYVTLSGLTVRFAGGLGAQVLGDYDTVETSRLIFNGKGGASLFPLGHDRDDERAAREE